MNYTSFNPDYCIYKFNNAYLIVAQQFAKIIRQYVTEYQGLSSVPANIKIQGILTNEPNAKHIHLLNNHMTDVEINKLQFDVN